MTDAQPEHSSVIDRQTAKALLRHTAVTKDAATKAHNEALNVARAAGGDHN